MVYTIFYISRKITSYYSYQKSYLYLYIDIDKLILMAKVQAMIGQIKCLIYYSIVATMYRNE